MCVAGICSTTSGVYPSALDVAYSKGSKADPALLARLQTTIRQQSGSPVDDVIFRPPFPLPYTRPHSTLCASHHKDALSPSLIGSFDILSTQFCAGGNTTPEQADIPCKKLDQEVLWRSLTALVGLQEETDLRQVEYDIRYFFACDYDFGLAYAAARVAWKHYEPRMISTKRSQWHKHAYMLDEARSKVIERDLDSGQELISLPYSIMPCRIWDLRSNRVVDFRMLHAAQSTIGNPPPFWAVTHSWTNDMSPMWTAINQHQWPVPLPKDISLEYLRSELLELGAEFVSTWVIRYHLSGFIFTYYPITGIRGKESPCPITGTSMDCS